MRIDAIRYEPRTFASLRPFKLCFSNSFSDIFVQLQSCLIRWFEKRTKHKLWADMKLSIYFINVVAKGLHALREAKQYTNSPRVRTTDWKSFLYDKHLNTMIKYHAGYWLVR